MAVTYPRSKKKRAIAVLEMLHELYPDATCSLDYETPVQLMVATILSAQCTDERVNKVTPALWNLADNPHDMSQVSVEDIQQIIRPCGLSPQKSKAIHRLSQLFRHDSRDHSPFCALSCPRHPKPQWSIPSGDP